MEKEIRVPIIEKIGIDNKGKPEYQVIVYNKWGHPHRIDQGLGVSKEEAEKIKKEYLQKQIQKQSIIAGQVND